MMRIAFRTALAVTLFVTAACSQPAARVDLRGQNIYGRNGVTHQNDNRQYAARPSVPYKHSASSRYNPPPVYTNTRPVPSHISQSTEQVASVQSIGVSDLPPPSATASPAPAAPVSAKPKPVNLWTNKPHSNDAGKPQKIASSDSSAYMWPVNSRRVVSGFGPKGSGRANDGITIASAEGEPVWASADGEVVYVGDEIKGYGNMILIKHPGNKTTTYAHLNRAVVDKYDRVKQGDIIGYVGSTGGAKKPQLHFAVHEGKTAVDPKKYLSTSVAGL